ncbi:MAG TPA: hypothetical protein VGC06_16020 [Actinomycetes bacterium]
MSDKTTDESPAQGHGRLIASLVALGALLAALAGLLAQGSNLVDAVSKLIHHTDGKAALTVACALPEHVSPGETITLVYGIDAPKPMHVGLGAGVYDGKGHDHSTGLGDVDDLALAAGATHQTRPVEIPDSLPSGRYEVAIELWPANQIGEDGADTLADRPCGSFEVP